MDTDVRSAIHAAVLALLRPLVRILLRNGVTHDTFSDLAKRAYVDVAHREFTIPGRKQTISRVSVLTGLTRKEVARILKAGSPEDRAARDRYNRAVRVIGGWLNDPDFLHDGAPAELPLEGDHSFAELVRRYSGDIPPRAMLTELSRVRVTEETVDGRVRLLRHAYIPSDDPVEKIAILGTDVAELIATIDHNLNPGDRPLFFQRKVSNDRFPPERARAFRELSGEQAMALLERLDHWLLEQEQEADRNDSQGPRMGIGLGIYYLEHPADEEQQS